MIVSIQTKDPDVPHYLIPDGISVAYGNSVINLTTYYESPQFIFLNFDYPNTNHTIMRINLDH